MLFKPLLLGACCMGHTSVYLIVWGFPKIKDTSLGVPKVRTVAFGGL